MLGESNFIKVTFVSDLNLVEIWVLSYFYDLFKVINDSSV